MSNNNDVTCGEKHEMIYILQKYGKSPTQKNIDILTAHCRAFRMKREYWPYKREKFYQYIMDNNCLFGMK